MLKRAFYKEDVMCEDDLKAVIDNSATCNVAASVDTVDWIEWKKFLGQFFKPGFSQGISKVHVIEISMEDEALVYKSKLLSTSEGYHSNLSSNDRKNKLMKKDITLEMVRNPARYGLKPLEDFRVEAEPISEARTEYLNSNFKSYYNGKDREWKLFIPEADHSDVTL